jgi:hypothetical protein
MRYAKLVNKIVVPCELEEMALQGEDFENNRRVALTHLSNNEYISTVFLGINHGWRPNRPIWFETMAFVDNEKWNHYQDRYETYEEAERGHEKVVNAIKAGLNPDDIL